MTAATTRNSSVLCNETTFTENAALELVASFTDVVCTQPAGPAISGMTSILKLLVKVNMTVENEKLINLRTLLYLQGHWKVR